MSIICNTNVEGDVGELLSKVVSQTKEAIVCVECASHTVVLYNSGAENLFGYEADDILGESVTNIMPIQAHTNSRVQTTGTRKDGSKFALEIVISTVDMNDKKYCAVIAREMETALATAEVEEYRKDTKKKLLKEMGSIMNLNIAARSN